MGAETLAAGIIGGSGLLGNAMSYMSQQSANKTNIRLAEMGFQHDIDMWNRQNEYNTPAAQMQRYSDAGLNKNLIYGQGSNGNAQGSPTYKAPHVQPYNFQDVGTTAANAINTYNNTKLNQAQVDNLEAQKVATQIQSQSELIKQIGYALSNKNSDFDLNQKKQLQTYQLQAAQAGVTKTQKETENLVADIKLKDQNVKNLQAVLPKIQAEIENIKSSTMLNKQEKIAKIVQLQQLSQQILKTKSERYGIDWDNWKKASGTDQMGFLGPMNILFRSIDKHKGIRTRK